MDTIRKFFGSLPGKCIVAALILTGAFILNRALEYKQEQNHLAKTASHASQRVVKYAPSVKKENKLLKDFRNKFPKADVLATGEEDVTNDDLKDLVIIFRNEGLTRTMVVMNNKDGGNYTYSTPVPGPVENPRIQFKNIDNEDEIEFIITGEKKSTVGYAIYRMIDNEPVDLFGDGMEECC